MGNIIDYIKWRGDLTFSKSDINLIDIFILAQTPILDLDGIVSTYKNDVQNKIKIKDINKKYINIHKDEKELGLLIPIEFRTLLNEMSQSKRFRSIEAFEYINIIDEKKEEQFSAMTFNLKEDLNLICFSGTDDTIIGWKENLNMIFSRKIPSQDRAMEYVKYISEKYPGKIITAGHSKGGNMSLYGAMGVNIDCLQSVYCFDSPGVNEITANSDRYKQVLPLVTEVIPNSSIVGKLFIHQEKVLVVNSNKEGFYQHDPFSWEILGRDFVYAEKINEDSIAIDSKIKEILSEMTEEEKIAFSDSCYKLLTTPNAIKLIDLEGKSMNLISAYFKLSKEDKKSINKPVLKLIKEKYFQKALLSGFKEFRSIKSTKKIDKPETN